MNIGIDGVRGQIGNKGDDCQTSLMGSKGDRGPDGINGVPGR